MNCLLFEQADQLHDCVGKSACDERAYGNALEEEYTSHRADDESRNDFRCALQKLDAAAACSSGQDPGNDGNDAERCLERFQHGLDGDLTCSNRDEDGCSEQDDAPVQPIGANDIEQRGQAQKLQHEHDRGGIGYRGIMPDDAQEQDKA